MKYIRKAIYVRQKIANLNSFFNFDCKAHDTYVFDIHMYAVHEPILCRLHEIDFNKSVKQAEKMRHPVQDLYHLVGRKLNELSEYSTMYLSIDSFDNRLSIDLYKWF
jgi:hypothetical protein